MLSLQSATSPRWLAQVDAALDDVIIDHAHCEKKAAGVAMNLLFSYVDRPSVARSMPEPSRRSSRACQTVSTPSASYTTSQGTIGMASGGDAPGTLRPGGRFTVGVWFDPRQLDGIEASYLELALARHGGTWGNASGAILARPYVDAVTGANAAVVVPAPGAFPADPALLSQSIRVGGTSLFNGAEVLLRHSLVCDLFHRRYLVGGYRYFGLIDRLGEMPLPPYITQRLSDQSRYQTVYARDAKSAAAPTAGLHFTPKLLSQIRAMGVATVSVELVVGLDTFAPVTVDDPRDHVIHTESYHVPAETLDAVEAARRVVAVGTTATRALESFGATGKTSGRTDLFITPGFSYRYVDVMLTNFHMPRTTLLLMISAFVGERWRRLYEHAVRNEYRFLSFGDAMLLDRHS